MHILYICNEYPPTTAGGIGPAVATLARGMTKAGHRASCIGVYPNITAPSVEQDDQVTVYRYPYVKKHRWIDWIVARRQMRAAILDLHRTHPIDVIEWPDYQGWYWRPIPGVANVVKVHGTHMSHYLHGFAPRNRVLEHLELRTLRQIPNWIGVSYWFNAEWRAIANVTPRREVVVYNPVKADLFVPPTQPRDPNLILYAGGLRKRKGVAGLARAASIFLRELPNARLVLIGFPNDLTEADVRSLAGPDVADRVQFIPYMNQQDLAKYMASAALYAMPSLYESCGNTWLEAASCQTPVIGSTLSCGPEIVLDNQTGLLANPENPDEIAQKVIRLMTDRPLAEQLGLNARKRILDLFSLDVAVRTSETFYKQCMAQS